MNFQGYKSGLLYGLLWGFGAGVSMGYGNYSVMPIPYAMALSWFLGTVVQGSLAGILTGLIVRVIPPPPPPAE